jgi:hypothetical protein
VVRFLTRATKHDDPSREKPGVIQSNSGGLLMAMPELTPQQRQLIEQAGNRPVRLEDAETRQAYMLIRADLYERVRDILEQSPVPDLDVPEGIRRSREAFFRELPTLLEDRALHGKWVAYHGDERVRTARTEAEVIRECLRRGLKRDQYDIFVVRPQAPEPEEVDSPSAWYDA